MILPTLPLGEVVNKEGMLTPDWNQFFTQLLLYMNSNLSSEGFVQPSQPTTNIAQLTNANNGTIIYDSTTDQFKGKIAGTFKTFTLV